MDTERMPDALKYYSMYLKHETSPQAKEMVAEVKAVIEGIREELEGQGSRVKGEG